MKGQKRKNMKLKTAEILCVGTELLIGDIVNTNAAFLSGRLAEMGIAQYHQSVVGDNEERLEEAVQTAIGRCDLLILTGGLGPTYDDMTKRAVARALGLDCIADDNCTRHVQAYCARRGTEFRACDRNQCLLPRGAFSFCNRWGSANGVGLVLPSVQKIVVMLPGPPRETRPMFDTEVRPYLEQFTDGVIVSRNLNLAGIGEPAVEELLSAQMRAAVNPSIAPYCTEGEVRLRVSARADTREAGERMCDRTVRELLATEIGKYVYGVDTGLAQATVTELNRRGWHIATAESCTGGLISAMLTAVPGASRVLEGSFVTYADRTKQCLLGVSPETIARHTAVSEQTAREMAQGVCQRLSCEVGVSVTGYAGPDGGDAENPVGTVFVGVCVNGKTDVERHALSGTRDYIRTVAAKRALSLALRAIRSAGMSEDAR